MDKPTVYLETTIANYVFNNQYPERQQIAKKLFRLIEEKEFQAFVSDMVVKEVEKAPEPRRSKLIKLIKLIKKIKVLPVDKKVQHLAERYIKEGVFPKTKVADATHVAVASVFALDYVLSWNFEHIVRVSTKQKVQAVNQLLGYKTPIIAVPEEVI